MPYKIAFLSKYPPLEGGIAAKTYWLARGLAARGHIVHVITHGISAGREYRIQGGEVSPATMSNLWVHRPPDEMPWHIPEDNEHALALLDLTINVIREHAIQILDTDYLIPYGILGHLAKCSTGAYHVVRHGGSDLDKFLKRAILKTILTEVISGADTVITEKRHRDLLEPMNPRLVFQPAYIPDETVFTSRSVLEPRRRLASIGKINYYWQHKDLHDVARIMQELTDKFECWFVGQGKGMSDFQHALDPQLTSSLKWCPFVPPWEMPSLLDQVDGIFIFESRLPYPAMSNLALEALFSGVGIITDRRDFAETYQDLVTIGHNQILLVPPSDHSLAAEMIVPWIRERACTRQASHQLVSYQEWLSTTEAVYSNVLNACQAKKAL